MPGPSIEARSICEYETLGAAAGGLRRPSERQRESAPANAHLASDDGRRCRPAAGSRFVRPAALQHAPSPSSPPQYLATQDVHPWNQLALANASSSTAIPIAIISAR